MAVATPTRAAASGNNDAAFDELFVLGDKEACSKFDRQQSSQSEQASHVDIDMKNYIFWGVDDQNLMRLEVYIVNEGRDRKVFLSERGLLVNDARISIEARFAIDANDLLKPRGTTLVNLSYLYQSLQA